MFTPDLLRGNRALITGGGTGIGKAMARRFLQLGAAVHICGRRQPVLQETENELARDTGGPIRSHVCDVRDGNAVDKMIAAIWDDGPLDILVNNAAGNFLARTEELSPGAFQAVVGIVLMGTINLTMACGRRWLKAGHKAVVLNILTTYAATGSAYVVPSAVAKAGVLALTRSLAVEWGPRGVRFNAIAPGAVRTEGAFSRLLPRPDLEQHALQHNPLRRFGTLEECANLAAFLVSDGSGYINGDMITMDGGAWLQGAGGFSELGNLLSDQDWDELKPRKTQPGN